VLEEGRGKEGDMMRKVHAHGFGDWGLMIMINDNETEFA